MSESDVAERTGRTGRTSTVRHPAAPNFCGCVGGCLLGQRNRTGAICRYRHGEVKTLAQLGVNTDPDADREFHVSDWGE